MEALESLVSFQERTLARLDEVVKAFAARVEELEGELTHVKRALPPDPVGPHDDPPPHYS